MHNTVVGQMLHGLEHAEHVVLDLLDVHLVQISQERLTFLILEHKAYLAFEAVPLNQFCYI